MSDVGEVPGQRLLALCSQDWAGAPHRRMTTFENALFEECLTLGRSSGSSAFRSYLARAVRASIEAGNAKLVRRLLAEEPCSHLVLTEVKDVVNKAIGKAGRFWPTDLKTLRLLIDHGASVSSVDDHGDTPLVLSCRQGDCELFKFLLEAGAAGEGCWAEQQDTTGYAHEPAGHASHSSGNLLQAAWQGLLASERYAPADDFWKTNLDTTWCGVVMLLLDKDSTFSGDEPCLVTLLHMACVQGNLAYVRRLLDYGVNMNVPADYFEERVYVYGSAIHAAARGGHRHVLELLLSRGAKPNEKLACKLPIPFCWRLWGGPLLAPLDIILVCGHDLAICEALGTTMDEYQLLLTEVAVQGKTELVSRLLAVGARLEEVPNTRSLEAVQLLRASGAKVDHERLRQYAAGCGCVEVLRYVVDEFGPALSTGECLTIARQRLHDPREMLGYLIKESGIKVNHVFHDAVRNQVTNLLNIACLELNWLAVTFLLEEGADPSCPGLPETALDTVRRLAATVDPVDPDSTFRRHDYEIIVEALSRRDSTGVGLAESPPTSPTECESSSSTSSNERGSELILGDDHAEKEGFPCGSDPPPRSTRPTRAMSVPDAYGAFEYNALQSLGAIRILEIQPSRDGEAFIVCRLIDTNLASRPEYDTLSYVWGSETDEATCPSIALNGRKFFITPNLWSAMHCLRHETETRTIWIDAICIDQRHVQERNEQVSLMGDIYRNAREVFIWLGEEAENSHLVFEQMQVAGNGTDSFQGKTLRAYENLCRRPWFYRTWVLQEIALSRKATVVCGRDSMSFHDFLPTSFSESSFHPLEGQDVTSHLRKMSELAGWERGLQVLDCAMFCHATDLRDKVYGLLGILDHLDIQVDYALDVATVFQNFTRALIQADGLRVLHQYGTQRLLPDLPTWVQDLSIMSPVGAISGGHNSRLAGDRDYTLTETDGSTSTWRTSAYPDCIMPGMAFRGNALVIRGKRLERIEATGEELCAEAAYAPGTDKFRQVLGGWETLAAELLGRQRFPHTVLQAFLETLTVEDRHVMLNDASESWPDGDESMEWGWYRQFGTGVLTSAENARLVEDGQPARWPGVLDAEGVDRSDVRYINNQVTEACYGRRLFVTHQGSMGLAAPRARAGDQVVFLPGGRYPFVLRQREEGDWLLMGDCYLYDFNTYQLFEDSARVVEEFVIR